MPLKTIIRRLVESTGYTIHRLPVPSAPAAVHERSGEPPKSSGDGPPGWREDVAYSGDGLRSMHNHDFMRDASFWRAYNRGIRAAGDLGIHWRLHIALWAASTASRLGGDFVECGVNRGFVSSAIMEFLDWDSLGRTFYLLDTFEGLDPRYVSDEERGRGFVEQSEKKLSEGIYVRGVDSVKSNFSQWKRVKVIQGSVPETLDKVDSSGVAYLHLDMNCSIPEVAAMDFFWDRLLPGAVVLFDDYAYFGYEEQKQALDGFAQKKQLMIASLPTGQGLLLRPPERGQRDAASPDRPAGAWTVLFGKRRTG